MLSDKNKQNFQTESRLGPYEETLYNRIQAIKNRDKSQKNILNGSLFDTIDKTRNES